MLRFGIVGLAVMLVCAGLTWIFGQWFTAQIAYLLAYPLALLLHFTLHRWWTFKDQSAVRKRQLGDYAITVLVTFAIQWSVFTALTHWTLTPAWLATVVSSLTQMAVSFLMMQRRVFAAAKV